MKQLLEILQKAYPDATCSLDFANAWQLLVSTILSAQCTDERVNKVTPALFARFPDARTAAAAKLSEVEKLVQSTGFYKNKALAIVECARAVTTRHEGAVPKTLDELTALRGVGRKTANVVLGNAYGIPGVVVDTHVARLAMRLGLSRNSDAGKIEQDLMVIVPREKWTAMGHLLISHGRSRCVARKPDCLNC